MFNKKIIISRHFLKLFNSDVSIIEQVVLVNIRKFICNSKSWNCEVLGPSGIDQNLTSKFLVFILNIK